MLPYLVRILSRKKKENMKTIDNIIDRFPSWKKKYGKKSNSRNIMQQSRSSKVDRYIYFEVRSLGKSYSTVTSIVSLGRTPEIRSYRIRLNVA